MSIKSFVQQNLTGRDLFVPRPLPDGRDSVVVEAPHAPEQHRSAKGNIAATEGQVSPVPLNSPTMRQWP